MRFITNVASVLLFASSILVSSSAAAQDETSGIDLASALVGRVIVGGRDVCSGALVTPSVVLTAGHCLQPEGLNRPVSKTRVKFLIKSPRDGERRIFSIADIGILPEFSYRSALNPGISSLQGDMALIKLDGIATRRGHEEIGNPAASNGIGYIPKRIGADRSPEGSESCLTRIMDNELMILSCHREEGFSGSPVFAFIEGERRIVGVVTARSERSGVPVLYASVPHLRMHDIIWTQMHGDHQIKMISAKSRSTEGKKENHRP